MQEDEPTYEQPDRPVRDFPADINSVYGLDEDNLKVLLRDLLLDKDFGTTVNSRSGGLLIPE